MKQRITSTSVESDECCVIVEPPSEPTLQKEVSNSINQSQIPKDTTQECRCTYKSVCKSDMCFKLGPQKQREIVTELLDDFKLKKPLNSVVAIIDAKWW